MSGGAKIDETRRWTVDSKREVGEIFGRSQRTITEWARQGMPRIGGGQHSRYDVLQVQLWALATGRIENPYAAQAPDDAPKTVKQLRDEADLKKVQLQVERLDHELSDLRASRYTAKDVDRMFAERTMIFRTAHLELPGALAPELEMVPATQAKAVLASRLRAIFEAYANFSWRELLDQWRDRARKGASPHRRGRRKKAE